MRKCIICQHLFLLSATVLLFAAAKPVEAIVVNVGPAPGGHILVQDWVVGNAAAGYRYYYTTVNISGAVLRDLHGIEEQHPGLHDEVAVPGFVKANWDVAGLPFVGGGALAGHNYWRFFANHATFPAPASINIYAFECPHPPVLSDWSLDYQFLAGAPWGVGVVGAPNRMRVPSETGNPGLVDNTDIGVAPPTPEVGGGEEILMGEECPAECDALPGDVPAVSEWGMLAMVLLVLAVGTIVFRLSRRARAV